MSFLDNLFLWLHIAFAIFALGPVAAVTMATPRYIRARDVNVLRYLNRTTRIFGVLSLGVFLFGLLLGRSELGKPYLSASMTLFIVAAIIWLLILRDQKAAIAALSGGKGDAQVQVGRIAALSGVFSLLLLIILVLMIWF
ncbi:DUF2269 family protein [Rhizohabitans arisaemae]|uniref:DUF2269 family protein n=1 Tax=Rhizohabitans arisaemae TaxID=2720610 RepID=UPI0024B268A6|nr:DUF2269 family protein [Rhizohabitans arisaemae]